MSPEAAVIIDLHNRDGSTQEVVATFPLEAIPGQRADEDEGGEMLPHVKPVWG